MIKGQVARKKGFLLRGRTKPFRPVQRRVPKAQQAAKLLGVSWVSTLSRGGSGLFRVVTFVEGGKVRYPPALPTKIRFYLTSSAPFPLS